MIKVAQRKPVVAGEAGKEAHLVQVETQAVLRKLLLAPLAPLLIPHEVESTAKALCRVGAPFEDL
ncbi:MAG: hypothetical protein LC647_05205 [Beggiatoa sp.]|nr:hypothetical protein [Beggiatoa sp.]